MVIDFARRVRHIGGMYALEVRDLRKTYKNGVEALKGVSLTVEEGDFFALLGPNGAGKSTLIGIISSLVNASGGDVKVFGAGHLSSAAEMDRVAAGEVPVQEFVCEDVIAHAKSVWEFNSILFVADSLEAYHDECKRFFDAMPDA